LSRKELKHLVILNALGFEEKIVSTPEGAATLQEIQRETELGSDEKPH
jgi:hypothetical protein